MTVDRDLLDLLGLPDARALRLEGRVGPPPPRTAEAAGVRDLLALLASLGAWGSATPMNLGVYRAEQFLAVPADAQAEVLRGTPVAGGALLGFDTRAERVVLCVRDDDGRMFVVDAKDGTVDTYALADALADLPDLEPPPPAIAPPDLTGWFAQLVTEPWLAAACAEAAASPSSVDRLAAAGLFARLWAPPEEHPSTGSAGAVVRAWARSLDPRHLDPIEADAVRRAWRLTERIAAVGGLADDLADREVAAIIRDRDDLASVARLLRTAGLGARLTPALAAADRVATEHMSALADRLPQLDDDADADRWRAVAWQEPDAWWAGS